MYPSTLFSINLVIVRAFNYETKALVDISVILISKESSVLFSCSSLHKLHMQQANFLFHQIKNQHLDKIESWKTPEFVLNVISNTCMYW